MDTNVEELLREIVEDGNWVETNPEEGSQCFYCGCGVEYGFQGATYTHRKDCLVLRIESALDLNEASK